MKKSVFVVFCFLFICQIANASEWVDFKVPIGELGGSKIYPSDVKKGVGENDDDYWALFRVAIPIASIDNFDIHVYANNPFNQWHISRHDGLTGQAYCYPLTSDVLYCFATLLTKNGYGLFNAYSVFLSFNASDIYSW